MNQITNTKNMMKIIGKGILFGIVPVLYFYLMEFYMHNPFEEVRTGAQFYNSLLFELLAWILFFLIGRSGWALGILGGVTIIFGLTNYYVMEFRSTPFVPWDLLSINTAASVAGNYDYMPSKRVVIVTILIVALMVAGRFIKLSCPWKIYFRIIPFLVIGLCLGVFARNLQDEKFQMKHYLYPFLFTPGYMMQVNGMAVTFTMNLQYLAVDKPAGYSKADAQEVLQSYQKKGTVDSGTDEGTDAEELPNIIVVMDEAFSDLSVLGNFMTNEDVMPFVHSLQNGAANTISGYANVSVCGGNTANSEFEFLTGNTMAFLPAGSIPYQQYIKKEIPGITSHLKELGYTTCAMHPYNSSGWDRDQVYPDMGFDQLVFKDSFSFPKYIRKYISDESDMEKIIQLYENKQKGQPMFLFNVTMQNHGGYTDEYTNFTPDITVNGVDNQALEQYLSLVKISDQEFEKLVNYFANADEKTVIVFFGDHQPNDTIANPIWRLQNKSSSTLTEEEKELRYKVPFVIWANYDIEEKSGEETSLNYLGAQVLEAAGVETSSYQNYLLELQKSYPIISSTQIEALDENGNAAAVKNYKKESMLLEYQKLQYYQLFDWEEETE